MPDSERKEINEKAIQEDTTLFHPSGKAELLLVFNVFDPTHIEKTISKYPHIGAKVYACSDTQIAIYTKSFLLEAIKSLKIQQVKGKNTVYIKTGKLKTDYKKDYEEYISEIENNLCNFDINLLALQIKEECVKNSNDTQKWGDYDFRNYDYQTTLILRIINFINTDIFKKLFRFDNCKNNYSAITDKIDEFFSSDASRIFRINFEDIHSSFSAREIVANALAKYLLNKARNKEFVKNPIVLFLDEAHQFLNKEVKDEFSDLYALDAFDLIEYFVNTSATLML